MPADTIKLSNQPPFEQVQITDFRQDRVVFRGLSGEVLRIPLGRIEWLELSDQARFSAAERAAAAGDWAAAAENYRNALARESVAWRRALLLHRRAATLAGGPEFDQALRAWLDLARERGDEALPLLARLQPGPPGSETNRRARDTLRAATEESLPAAPARRVRQLLLELALYDNAPAAEPRGRPTAAPPDPPATTRATRSILPDEPAGSAPAPAAELHRPELNGLTLTSESWLLPAAERAADEGDYVRAAALANGALPYVPAPDRPRWHVVLGRCRIEVGDPAAAAAELLAIARDTSDTALAASALYYVAVAHERLGRSDVARSVYRELASRETAPLALRERARLALSRLERSP